MFGSLKLMIDTPDNSQLVLIWRLRAQLMQKRGDLYAALNNYERYLSLGGGLKYGDDEAIRRIINHLKSSINTQ